MRTCLSFLQATDSPKSVRGTPQPPPTTHLPILSCFPKCQPGKRPHLQSLPGGGEWVGLSGMWVGLSVHLVRLKPGCYPHSLLHFERDSTREKGILPFWPKKRGREALFCYCGLCPSECAFLQGTLSSCVIEGSHISVDQAAL